MKSVRVRLYVSEERVRAWLAQPNHDHEPATAEVRALLGSEAEQPMPKGYVEISPRPNARGVLEVLIDA